MIESTKFIKNLIYSWCIKEDRYGLTLPNIIGAVRLKTEKKNYSITDFFNELPNVEIDIKISSCGDLEEYVIGTFKSEDAPKNYYNQINSIYYSTSEIDVKNYEELISLFRKKYSDKIDSGLYSKDYYTKEWSDLNEEDIEFLNNINE
ncbi:hypothetical protein LX77_03898 [Gelidibacter algens]|uniref:Uncharacterized protein n=1 Tax=Gelidibacter algens TaxID=49280 RepID=A0A327RN51_9FLAO|nr:hypothetical protein [Gelidibacter algens]RAJ17352.1 hypothetical protein LX77_03898 [Gelidibacter algens]